MGNSDRINISYRFVSPGTAAPEKIESNEIWLDVGGRLEPGVLDHHFGDSPYESAAEAVFNKAEDFIRNYTAGSGEVVIVTHSNPDLDAVCSAWLTELILTDYNAYSHSRDIIAKIVDEITKNDQGIIECSDLAKCWVIVMRYVLYNEMRELSDEDTIREMFRYFNNTVNFLWENDNINEISDTLYPSDLSSLLKEETAAYQSDLKKAEIIEISLPLSSDSGLINITTDMLLQIEHKPAAQKVDGLQIEEPGSDYFKIFARNDKENSPLGKGFTFLLISFVVYQIDNLTYYRHIVSVDPAGRVTLKGLGYLLEKAEQAKEERLAIELPPERERHAENSGRFGYNVSSPWYDGRGHNYTIIDSPSITIDDKSILASILNPDEVIQVIRKYEDMLKG